MGPVAGEGGRGWREPRADLLVVPMQLPIPYYSVYSATKAGAPPPAGDEAREPSADRGDDDPPRRHQDRVLHDGRAAERRQRQQSVARTPPELFMQTPEFVARKTVRAPAPQ